MRTMPGMSDPAPSPATLPDGWWHDEDFLLLTFLPDTIGLVGEPADTPRARVSDVVTAEMIAMHHTEAGVPWVVAPPFGSPHFGEAVHLLARLSNSFSGRKFQIEVLDAEQGRARVGSRTGILRPLVLLKGESLPLRRPIVGVNLRRHLVFGAR